MEFKKSRKVRKDSYPYYISSLEECPSYLILAEDLGYGETLEHMIVLGEVSRFLQAYTHRIRASSTS
jgi:hypothetical protein